jgi:hypothetical protein
MDWSKTEKFAVEIRPCSSCKHCGGKSDVDGEVLCKNDKVASEKDSFIGTSDYSCEFIRHNCISITQPFDLGLDCEYRINKKGV